MKILLVQPDSVNAVVNSAMHIYNFEPIGLYYLGASVRSSHDVALVDLNSETVSKGYDTTVCFLDALRIVQPHVVAFSALTSVRTSRIKQLAGIVKKHDRNICTIVGGVHASLCPTDFSDDDVDIVVRGESIWTFQSIINLIEQGNTAKEIAKELATARYEFEASPLRHWPKPYRALGAKYKESYRINIGKPGYNQLSHSIASVKTSSGCPFRCKFCCLWQLYPKHETRDVDSVVEEISCLTEDYVFLADDESLLDVDYMGSITDALIASGVRKKYVMYGRTDTIAENPRLMDKLTAAGLKEVWIGLEGSTNYQLELYRKNNSVDSHRRAIEVCRDRGVNVHATALVNYQFTRDDFDFMLTYTQEILGLRSCHFFVLTPFKGTTYYDRMIKEQPDRFLTTNSDYFSIRQSVLKPEHMNIEEFHQRYADLQRNFNSDTIPFSLESSDDEPSHIAEFEWMKSRNDILYESILRAHFTYP